MNKAMVTGFVVSVEHVNYYGDKWRWEVVIDVHNPRLTKQQRIVAYGYSEKAAQECQRLHPEQLAEFHGELSCRQGRDGRWYSEFAVLYVDAYPVDPE